jgi:hypothetical protein
MRPSPLVHSLVLANSRTHHLESLAKARATASTSIRLPHRRIATLRHLLPRPRSASAVVLLLHRSTQAFLRALVQQARLVRCKIRSRALSAETKCLVKRWKWAVVRLKKPWLSLKAPTTRSSTPPTTTILWLAQHTISFKHNRAALRHFRHSRCCTLQFCYPVSPCFLMMAFYASANFSYFGLSFYGHLWDILAAFADCCLC